MKIEIREKEVIISGYVNAVCRDSRVMKLPDGTRFVEQVQEGVFSKAIAANNDIKLKFNHEKIIGSTADGNLELKEDSIGLYATARVTDPDVIAAADAGKITGWSFGFNVIGDDWEDWTMDGVKRRRLKDIQLNEVSILSDRIPAYAGTSYELRGEDVATMETRGLHEIVVEKTDTRTPAPTFDAEKIRKMRLNIKKMEV